MGVRVRACGVFVCLCVCVFVCVCVEQEADTKHVVMVLRGMELEKSTQVVTLVAMRSKSEEILLLAGAKTFERRRHTFCIGQSRCA